jgi:hypothetical protein
MLGVESRKETRNTAPEDCYLCSEEISVGADTMIYAGLRVHTDCYWRDIGLPPQRKRDSAYESHWGNPPSEPRD